MREKRSAAAFADEIFGAARSSSFFETTIDVVDRRPRKEFVRPRNLLLFRRLGLGPLPRSKRGLSAQKGLLVCLSSCSAHGRKARSSGLLRDGPLQLHVVFCCFPAFLESALARGVFFVSNHRFSFFAARFGH